MQIPTLLQILLLKGRGGACQRRWQLQRQPHELFGDRADPSALAGGDGRKVDLSVENDEAQILMGQGVSSRCPGRLGKAAVSPSCWTDEMPKRQRRISASTVRDRTGCDRPVDGHGRTVCARRRLGRLG